MLHVRPVFVGSPRFFLENRFSTLNWCAKLKDQYMIKYLEIWDIYIKMHVREDIIVSQYQLEKHWKVMCAIWLHILIRNWVKIKCATRQSDDYTKRLLRRLLRDKRPCGMPFNSRTDICWVDQGPMEIFDETSRKREQVPLPSNVTGRRYFTKRRYGNSSRQWQISKRRWNVVKILNKINLLIRQ